MTLTQCYSLASASSIDKPYIFEHYFPLPCEKYITFQAQSKVEVKDYDYWNDVISLLFPILEKHNIKIVQIGKNNEHSYKYTVDLRGKTDLNQLAYIIRNSQLHLGCDSLGIHIASSYDIALVGLYSVSPSTVSGPEFGSKERQICFDGCLRKGNQKASFSDNESPKSVNLIMPEEVANAVLKLLNLPEKIDIETIYIGERYGKNIWRELIPKAPVRFENPEVPIEIRMDINFNENVLAQQLSISKGIIITNKRISLDLLRRFKPNIASLVYLIEENDEPQFIQDIKNLGINIILMSHLSENEINNKKINYFEIGNVNKFKDESEDKKLQLKNRIGELFFRSNKVVVEEGKLYMSNVGRLAKEEFSFSDDLVFQKAIDSPEFWKELPFLRLVRKVNFP